MQFRGHIVHVQLQTSNGFYPLELLGDAENPIPLHKRANMGLPWVKKDSKVVSHFEPILTRFRPDSARCQSSHLGIQKRTLMDPKGISPK